MLNKVGNVQGGDNLFSTDEKVIGTQIDGKPIYRKVIVRQSAIDYDDVSSLNIDTIISFDGITAGVDNYLPLNYVNPVQNTYGAMVSYDATSGKIFYRVGTSMTLDTMKFIFSILYTKTTD